MENDRCLVEYIFTKDRNFRRQGTIFSRGGSNLNLRDSLIFVIFGVKIQSNRYFPVTKMRNSELNSEKRDKMRLY